MSVRVQCPCGGSFTYADEHLGKVVHCRECRQPLTVRETPQAEATTGRGGSTRPSQALADLPPKSRKSRRELDPDSTSARRAVPRSSASIGFFGTLGILLVLGLPSAILIASTCWAYFLPGLMPVRRAVDALPGLEGSYDLLLTIHQHHERGLRNWRSKDGLPYSESEIQFLLGKESQLLARTKADLEEVRLRARGGKSRIENKRLLSWGMGALGGIGISFLFRLAAIWFRRKRLRL